MNNKAGQATIEFLFSFILMISFVFALFVIAINSTDGFYAHYANFMASRTYLVVETNSNAPTGSDAASLREAKSVFDSFDVKTLFFKANGKFDVQAPDPSNQEKALYVGTLFKFAKAFTGIGMFGGDQQMSYTTQSFLGKEPTRAECIQRICDSIGLAGVECDQNVTLSDNGC